MHDAEAVALAVRLVAVAGQETVNPVVGLVTAVRLTVPAKLNVLVRLTEIEAPVAPELKFTGVPTEMVKSPTWTTELPEWDAVPGEPAPLIVARYVPAVVELMVQEVLTVAFAAMLVAVGGQATVSPVVGLTTDDKEMVPAKLFTLVSETEIEAPEAPELKLTGVPTDMEKSPT